MDDNVKIKDIINCIEAVAPLQWQEDYDNAGWITGNKENECGGVLICLDVFESTMIEAINNKCNFNVSHHPFKFRGIKKLHHCSETQKILTLALKNDIAIYSSHTNMDSALLGVNDTLGQLLQLQNIAPLDNNRYFNEKDYLGCGATGELYKRLNAMNYLQEIKKQLNIGAIKYSGNIEKSIKKVGFCGGAGSFLIEKAIENNCDIFLTGDLKYHDFLTFENKIILADIGHYESENCIKQRFFDIISKKMINFVPLFISTEKNRVKFL